MAAFIPLALMIAGGVGGAVLNKKLAPKPQPVAAPPPVPTMIDSAMGKPPESVATEAAERQRRRSSSKPAETILTSPRGLGEINPSNRSVKTLLGY